MRRSISIQIVLFAAGVLLIGWQFHRNVTQSRELESIKAEAEAQKTELESLRAALAAEFIQ